MPDNNCPIRVVRERGIYWTESLSPEPTKRDRWLNQMLEGLGPLDDKEFPVGHYLFNVTKPSARKFVLEFTEE